MAKLSESYGVPLRGKVRSTWELFLESVDRYPDNLALVCIHQPHDLFGIPSQPLDDDAYRQKPYLRWNFKHLREAIARFGIGLKEAGVKPGSIMFTFMPSTAEYMLARWAAAEMRCALVSINPRNLANREEVMYMIKTATSAVPEKQPFVIVANDDIAKAVDELAVFDHGIKIVASSSGASHGWLEFERLMSPSPRQIREDTDGLTDEAVECVILFTSGTTSMPKGCKKEYPMLSTLAMGTLMTQAQDSMAPGSSFACILPNNHAMGMLLVTEAHTAATTVVYPGPGFQVDTMLETLYREKVTQYAFHCHVLRLFQQSCVSALSIELLGQLADMRVHSTALVPTMVHALGGLRKSRGIRLDHLVSVILAGSVLNADTLRLCLDELGAKGAEPAYGMSEGILVRAYSHRDISRLIDGDDVTIGWAMPGVGLKIVDPNTNQIVPRNTLGELHGASPLLSRYIGDADNSTFYNDNDGRLWIKTGDQARMDDAGRLFITGRYKEMIIRGGVNMSPAAIEATLAKDARLAALLPQVVAGRDPIAGEVPVVIVLGTVDGNIREAVRNAILKNMGAIYLPDDIVSIHDLGLSEYPRTMAGKVQKQQLIELVKKYRDDRDSDLTASDNSQLATEVRDIWARAVGLEPSRLSLETPIGEFADSITVMRVRDMVTRKTGKTLPLADMASAATISGHIKLLSQASVAASKPETKHPIREGPPQIDDMSHLTEDPDLFEPTRELIEKTLSPYGLDWNDVEDVIPVYDFAEVMVETRIFDSWGFKFAILAKKANKAQLRKALETMLTANRLLASFLVRDKDLLESTGALHVAMRQDTKTFDIIIQDGGKLNTVQSLKDKASDQSQPPAFPGPLTRAALYEVEETGAAGAIIFVNHAVVDASTGQIFSEDLDRVLGGAPALSEHVDYKLWADSYYSLRTSPEARAATKWHVKRLKGLAAHKRALWPPYSMPQNQADAIVKGDGEDAVVHTFDAPKIQELRREHSHITATIVVKTAIALLNVFHTGHTHAIFSNLEAARTTFPFIPKTMEATGQFEATDVSGPTIQAVVNLVEFKPDETVLSLLSRMQEDQLNLTKYASAPLREIMSALGTAGSMIPEAVGHQVFNWVPGMGTTGTNPHEHFEMISAVVRPRTGFSVHAGIGGPETSTIFLHLRGVSFDREAYKKLGLELEKITLWLVARDNWDRPIGGFVDVLKSGQK